MCAWTEEPVWPKQEKILLNAFVLKDSLDTPATRPILVTVLSVIYVDICDIYVHVNLCTYKAFNFSHDLFFQGPATLTLVKTMASVKLSPTPKEETSSVNMSASVQ